MAIVVWKVGVGGIVCLAEVGCEGCKVVVFVFVRMTARFVWIVVEVRIKSCCRGVCL